MIRLYKSGSNQPMLEWITKTYPNHQLVRFNGFSGDTTVVIQELESDNLFGEPRVIALSGIDRELWNAIIKSLHHVSDSVIIVWTEDSFPVAFTKLMPAHEIIEQKEKKIAEKSNPFSIANQLSTARPSELWPTYRSLIDEGHEPEAIFGILWWKLKDLAKKKSIMSDSLKKTLLTFLSTYSQARSSGGDLEAGLEKILLTISSKDLQ